MATTLYPDWRVPESVCEYRTFTGETLYYWLAFKWDASHGDLFAVGHRRIAKNVSPDEVVRSLRQLEYKVGEWDG